MRFSILTLFLAIAAFADEPIRFPAAASVLDVTQPPYNAVPDDDKDDTAAIQAALEAYSSGNRFVIEDSTAMLEGINERNFNKKPVSLWFRETQGGETRERAERAWVYLSR